MPAVPALHAIDALVFDAYGTLFDVHTVTALAEFLAPGRGAAVSQMWRAKQLEYTWLTSLMAAPACPRPDFAAVTAQALDYALAALEVEFAPEARRRLCDGYLALSPFPDVRAALAALAPRPRWILSNGTLAMLEPLIRRTGVAADIDGVLSVDAADVFKPSPRVYRLAADRLSLLVHVGLYVLMVGLPLLGLLTLSAAGKPVTLWWGGQLPLLPIAAKGKFKSMTRGTRQQLRSDNLKQTLPFRIARKGWDLLPAPVRFWIAKLVKFR